MRKDDKEGKARVRVFFGEIEGDNETIRDGLRSIAAAVNKTFQQENTVVKVLAVGSDGTPKELAAATEQMVTEGEVADENEPAEYEPSGKSPSRSKSRPKKTPSYSLVKELNLRPTDKDSLRDFYKEKKPTDQQQMVTVVLYYLHRVLETEKISTNHIYTGLKDVEARVPPDINQILRNTASRRGWVDSGDSDDLKMTVTGDNFVEQDLPAKAQQNSGSG